MCIRDSTTTQPQQPQPPSHGTLDFFAVLKNGFFLIKIFVTSIFFLGPRVLRKNSQLHKKNSAPAAGHLELGIPVSRPSTRTRRRRRRRPPGIQLRCIRAAPSIARCLALCWALAAREENLCALIWGGKPRTATNKNVLYIFCLLYTSPSPRDKRQSRMPSSA